MQFAIKINKREKLLQSYDRKQEHKHSCFVGLKLQLQDADIDGVQEQLNHDYKGDVHSELSFFTGPS